MKHDSEISPWGVIGFIIVALATIAVALDQPENLIIFAIWIVMDIVWLIRKLFE